MNDAQQIREQVSKAYAKAVATPGPAGSCCCQPEHKGVVIKSAGYSAEELAALPANAVENAFGCGNPLAFSEVGEGDAVLDLGSGAGIDVLVAAKKVGPTGRVIGVDMTDDMIARAQANIAAAGVTNAEIRKGLIEELPVETASVDWVISNCVINLSPEKQKVFAEIARVLKPGGRMLVSDIVVQELPEAVRQSEALYCSCVAGAISEEEYVAGLREAGLIDVEVRERIVYDAAQLKEFIGSELPDNEAGCCAAAGLNVDELATEAVGKIWSAKFYARKP